MPKTSNDPYEYPHARRVIHSNRRGHRVELSLPSMSAAAVSGVSGSAEVVASVSQGEGGKPVRELLIGTKWGAWHRRSTVGLAGLRHAIH